MTVCAKCGGTKKCQQCRGYGITVLESESELDEASPKRPDIIHCKVCGGDGQCPYCDEDSLRAAN